MTDDKLIGTNPDDLIGSQIDEYLLEARLGEGGMARVYRGLDVHLQRYAAIKVITPAYRKELDYLERFEREARAIAGLEHPHIVRLYRYGEADGLLYMAMQFVEGMDLGSVLQDYRQTGEYLEYPEAVRLIGEAASALDYIHSRGIIHRDVKSSNIMLDKSGRAFLADFGLVLFTEAGTRGEVFGSPHYLAPEQAISSAKAVPQSDLYSLGVIAYEMFTGQLPFDAPDPLDIAMLHMSQDPPLPRSLRAELPEALEAVLLKALAKKPEDRYQSGADFAGAVRAALASPAATAHPLPRTSKTIPERVALDLEKRPLPPVPAVVPTPPPAAAQPVPEAAPPGGDQPVPDAAPPPPAGDLPVSDAALSTPAGDDVAIPVSGESVPLPAASLKKPSRLPFVLLSGAALLFACVLFACLLVLFDRHLLPGFTSSKDPAATSRPTLVDRSASTLLPQLTETANPLIPVGAAETILAPTSAQTPAPTLAAAITFTPAETAGITPSPSVTARTLPAATAMPASRAVTLVLVGCDDGHCLGILNQSQVSLPLAGLVISGKDYDIKGEDWDIAALPPGGCLVLTGDARKWQVDQEACDPADAVLVTREDFWKSDLEVAYAGQSYGVCRRDRRDCEFVIPVK